MLNVNQPLRSKVSQFDYLVHGCTYAVGVLSSGLCIVWLSASSALYELSSLADYLACVKVVILDHIIGKHY